MKRIPNEILGIMSQCTVKGNGVRITCGQLEFNNLRLDHHSNRVLNGSVAKRLADELDESVDSVVCRRVIGIG